MITRKQIFIRSTLYDYFSWVSGDNPIAVSIMILGADPAETGEHLTVMQHVWRQSLELQGHLSHYLPLSEGIS